MLAGAAAHRRLCGCGNATVLNNLSFLAKAGKLAEVRTVVVPEEMDAARTVREVSRRLCALGATEVPYKLIRFRPMGVRAAYKQFRSPTAQEMDALEAVAREAGMQTIIQI